jgi:hypothetical protein
MPHAAHLIVAQSAAGVLTTSQSRLASEANCPFGTLSRPRITVDQPCTETDWR